MIKCFDNIISLNLVLFMSSYLINVIASLTIVIDEFVLYLLELMLAIFHTL